MNAVALLARLRTLDVRLEADGERLRLNAPPGVVDAELRRAVAERKAEILDLLARARRPVLPPIERGPREDDLPLSFAQQRIWFLTRLEPDGYAYNEPATVRLEGELRPELLAAGLAEVVRRHEVLRATVVERQGEPRLVIVERVAVTVPLADLTALPAERRQEAARRVLRRHARRPFDLGRGPLLRALLVRTGRREHIFSVVLQHLVCDGWSTGILAREVAAAYGALAAGSAPALPPLPIQYGDVALWQRRWLTDAVLEHDLAYWRHALAGLPAALELPTDRPRGERLSSRGGRCQVGFDAAETRLLEELARGRGATLFAVLMAGFQALLARHAGQDDLAVGTSVANRSHLETEPLIGFFVNTLVIRGRLHDDPAFGDLVERAHAATTAATAHQELPFERLVEALKPERAGHRTPLFQVMFVLQNFPIELRLPGVVMHRTVSSAEAAKFDLTLDLSEVGGALEGALEYNRDLFDAATVEALATRLRRLLRGGADHPGTPVSRLPLLDAAERELLLRRWGAGAGRPGPGDDVSERIAAWAERAPEAPAVVVSEETLTYGELLRRVRGLAASLVAAGVGPDVVVGVRAERGTAAVVAALAVLEAGGACLVLDPADPAERVAALLEDARARCLLAAGDSTPGAPAGVTVLGPEPAAGASPARPVRPPESLAYVVYTSGSTGNPKPVGVDRDALSEHLTAAAATFGLTPADRVLQIAAMTFDVALEQVLATLGAGATLVLRGPERWGPRELSAAVRRHRLTVVNPPTAVWRQWAAEALHRREAGPAPSLRLAIAGGDAMTDAALDDWLRGPNAVVRLLNAYGPTEGVITATVHETTTEPAEGEAGLPIGRPLDGRLVRVVDARGALVPPGATGELCLGGPLLARGYLRRPAATAERFVPDPWPQRAGDRLYRTGDRARFDRRGRLVMLGRLDRQVKVRGFRVEPGEIEAALAAHPGLSEAAVVVRADAGDKALVAFVVPAPGGDPPAAADLRTHLASRLPSYLVPSWIVPVEALPLTPHGKVDRGALRSLAQEGGAPEPAAPAEPPRGELETRLAALWRELLGAAAVGRGSDFFELGGHSLLGARLIARVEDAFGVDLPLTTLFEAPTLQALAARVAAAPRRADRAPIKAAPAGDSGGVLSFAQQRLWLLDRLDPGSTAYVDTLGLELEGPLSPRLLRRALDAVMARHDVLRTVFAEVDGAPRQRVTLPPRAELALVDLRALPAARREGEVARALAPDRQAPFDLGRGPLVRFRLLRLGSRRHVLIAGVHHIVGDAWSNAVLTEEVATAYRDFTAGRTPSLPPPALQYADYAAWQREALQGPERERLLGYWRGQLKGAPAVLDLPTERPRTSAPSSRGDLRRRRIGDGLTGDLRRLARERGASLYMVVLAAFVVWLGQRAGRRDLVLGTTSGNRERVELERMVGFFVNMLVLRVDLGGDPPFAEVVDRIRAVVLGALEHQALPFDHLVEALKVPRLPGRNPLFQVAFTYENAPAPPRRIGELALRPIPARLDTSIFDLARIVEESEGALETSVRYLTDLFPPATMDALLEQVEAVLQAAADDPAVRRSSLDARLGAMERDRRSARVQRLAESSLRARLTRPRGPAQVRRGELTERSRP